MKFAMKTSHVDLRLEYINITLQIASVLFCRQWWCNFICIFTFFIVTNLRYCNRVCLLSTGTLIVVNSKPRRQRFVFSVSNPQNGIPNSLFDVNLINIKCFLYIYFVFIGDTLTASRVVKLVKHCEVGWANIDMMQKIPNTGFCIIISTNRVMTAVWRWKFESSRRFTIIQTVLCLVHLTVPIESCFGLKS